MKDPYTAEPFDEEPEVLGVPDQPDEDEPGGSLTGGDPLVERGPLAEDVPDNEKYPTL